MNFIIAPIYRVLFAVAFWLISVIGMFFYGQHVGLDHCRAATLTKVEHQVKEQPKIVLAQQKAVEVVKWRTRTIKQEITKYVPTSPSCDLSPDAVRLLNSVNHMSTTGSTPTEDKRPP